MAYQRHWTSYIGFFDHALRLSESDSNLHKTERNVLRSWNEAHNMPRYRVGLMPDQDETVSATFDNGVRLL